MYHEACAKCFFRIYNSYDVHTVAGVCHELLPYAIIDTGE